MSISSREHISACLMKLRQVFGHGVKMSPEQMALQNERYIEALEDIPPDQLARACMLVMREAERFPLPKQLRQAAREIAERGASQPAAVGLAQATDPGAEARNEAILLLGMFAAEANSLTGAPSRRFAEFIAEAARLWGRVRPPGGLAEASRLKQRAVVGFALEGWARTELGAEPLDVGYASTKVREVHRQMTGLELETSDSGTLTQAGGLGGALRNAMAGEAA